MKDNYVSSHDFGYGKNKEIKQLHLRNHHDCKAYIQDVLQSLYNAKVKGNTLDFGKEIVQVMLFHRI